MSNAEKTFGKGDCSYQTAGGLDGLTQLVDAFYHYMDTVPEASHIRAMHPSDLTVSRKKLTYFLSGWLGGPKLYAEHFGGISIPMSHRHLNVGTEESTAWLLCMQKAVDEQDYDDSFKDYLMAQLRVPAARIQAVCGN